MCLFNIICAHLNLFIILFIFFTHTHHFILLFCTKLVSPVFLCLYNIYFLSKKKEYLVYMFIIIINSYTKLVETPFFR